MSHEMPHPPGSSTLLVTLVGFDGDAAVEVSRLIEDCSALGARWRVTDSGTSDLWVVNGRNACGLGRGMIEVGGEPAVRFRPAEMQHPVAFAEPLGACISTSHRFDATSMHSLNVQLTQLARWLEPRLVQQALVAQLIANGASFTRSNVIHVRHGGRLLALVDFGGDTAVAPGTTQADLRGADWELHDREPPFIPPGFRMARTEQLLWHYANRSETPPPLPPRYSRLPIHLRRMPALQPREFTDRQLLLLRSLAYAPHTLAQLAALAPLARAEDLRRDLAALYLVGAITCDPGRSRAARERRRAATANEEADLSFVGARPSRLDELTAPGLHPAAHGAGAAPHA